MRMEKFNKALDYIDYDLIDELVREKEAIERKRRIKRDVLRLSSIAACLVIFTAVGSLILGYGLANQKNMGGEIVPLNKAPQLTLLFSNNGKFVFEYEGNVYQAYVAPITSSESIDITVQGSVSIQNVGEHITDVVVTDEKGNKATMEIYSGKGQEDDQTILLKLDGGYFKATIDN